MLTSARWVNDYLDPPASPEEQAELATRAGFPLEDSAEVKVSDGTDRRQDFEMTSNRGDCVSHAGLAREIAAISGRTLKMPRARPTAGTTPAREIVTVTNHEKVRCPLYTARIIRGAKVGPSPAWLTDRLVARGDIPRNNVVDATNFVLFELGQPTHVFDLARLRGPEIIVRMAKPKEPFLPIGEGETEVALSEHDLVIADAERAVAIAGVKGGAVTAVTESSTDFLLEAASFDPVTVRNSSRRLGIASDSSYRFERGVPPGQVDEAANRLAELILDLAGGELCDGVVLDGGPIPERTRVAMRPARCRKILGVPLDDEWMLEALARLGFEPALNGERIDCLVPVHRLDIEREIDLIEEVGRMFGHDNIPVTEQIEVRVAPVQPQEQARQAISTELVGMGFVETVTHSLVGEQAAAAFLPPGMQTLRVVDDRAKSEPILQPSVMPSLLRVRRHNQDNGVSHLRLFESAATFRATEKDHEETVNLGLVMDVENADDGLRPIRGTIERLVEVLLGHEARIEVEEDTSTRWLAPGGRAMVGDREIGCFGLLEPATARQFGLDNPVLVAELRLWPFYEGYPPETEAHALPTFPAIERDLSVVVDEAVTWARIRAAIAPLDLHALEALRFVTTFRGKAIDKGRKSLTLRLRFRAEERTLTHEEVDPQVAAVTRALHDGVGAELRK